MHLADTAPLQPIAQSVISTLFAVGAGGLLGYGVGELLWRSSWRIAVAGGAVLALALYGVISGRLGSGLGMAFVGALVLSAFAWYFKRLSRPQPRRSPAPAGATPQRRPRTAQPR